MIVFLVQKSCCNYNSQLNKSKLTIHNPPGLAFNFSINFTLFDYFDQKYSVETNKFKNYSIQLFKKHFQDFPTLNWLTPQKISLKIYY